MVPAEVQIAEQVAEARTAVLDLPEEHTAGWGCTGVVAEEHTVAEVVLVEQGYALF